MPVKFHIKNYFNIGGREGKRIADRVGGKNKDFLLGMIKMFWN